MGIKDQMERASKTMEELPEWMGGKGKCPSCAEKDERIRQLEEECRSYRIGVAMILLSHGGEIRITREAQENVDMSDSVESITEIDRTMLLRYRRAGREG